MTNEVEIKQGPELDRAVAEAVGLESPIYFGGSCLITPREWDEIRGIEHTTCEGDVACISFEPSTDLNAAFAAAEKAVSQEWAEGERSWELSSYVGHDERGWTCSLGCDEHRVFSPIPALAICAAILKLKEAT